jgi:hypothetical protein
MPLEQEIKEEEFQEEQPEKKMVIKPFLKRKTKAVVVVKKEEAKKPEGKSRIDCWHRDKDTNTIIYGNNNPPPLMPRKSLLKAS